jgi:uncharacterized protein (DUF983 family)
MRDGKHCPACGADIGLWPVFSAGLPNWIRCPRCKARLSYQGLGALLAVLTLTVVALIAAAVFVTREVEGYRRILAAVAVLPGAWLPVELATALYLRANETLADRSGGPPVAHEKGAEAPDPPAPR